MRLKKHIEEETYAGNIGFEEMVLLYRKADKRQIKLLNTLVKTNNWSNFQKLVEKILGRKLK